MANNTNPNEIIPRINFVKLQKRDSRVEPPTFDTDDQEETLTAISTITRITDMDEPPYLFLKAASATAIWNAPTTQERKMRIAGYLELSSKTESIENQLIKINSRMERLESSISEIKENLPSFYCHNIKISYLPTEKWRLKEPININVEEHDVSNFIACFYEANIYGYGESIPECVEDLSFAIINQFEYLIDEGQKYELGAMPKHQLRLLKQVIIER